MSSNCELVKRSNLWLSGLIAFVIFGAGVLCYMVVTAHNTVVPFLIQKEGDVIRNKGTYEDLTELIDNELREESTDYRWMMSLSEARGQTRTYLHESCRELVMYRDHAVRFDRDITIYDYCEQNWSK